MVRAPTWCGAGQDPLSCFECAPTNAFNVFCLGLCLFWGSTTESPKSELPTISGAALRSLFGTAFAKYSSASLLSFPLLFFTFCFIPYSYPQKYVDASGEMLRYARVCNGFFFLSSVDSFRILLAFAIFICCPCRVTRALGGRVSSPQTVRPSCSPA